MRVQFVVRLIIVASAVMLTAALCGSSENAALPDIPDTPAEWEGWADYENWENLRDQAKRVDVTAQEYLAWEAEFGEAVDDWEAWKATAAAEQREAGSDDSSTTDGETPGTTAGAAEPPPDRTDCKLSHTDAAIPSIGRTGSAAYSTGLVPESLQNRDVGYEIRELIADGKLCPEHLVELYNDNDYPGVLSPEMRAAIETVVAELLAAQAP